MNKLLPREKAISQGIDSLTHQEILTILIGSGLPGVPASEIASELLSNAQDSLHTLSRMGIDELCKVKGVGRVTALELMAVFELIRRVESEQIPSIKVSNGEDAYQVIKPELSHLPHEEFWVLHLSPVGTVIAKQKVSQGGLTGAMVDQRIIFKKCYSLGTHSIVLCHNHPCGDVAISKMDIDLTSMIQRSCTLLGFKLVDHVIVCGAGYVSFADRGLL